MQCSKKRYESWDRAAYDAKMLARHRGARSAHPYRCKQCRGVHVGTSF